jgi:hypothetical protein
LHIGAIRIAPFHSCGSFQWIYKTTAPPIDSPYKNLALFLYSSRSTIAIAKQASKQAKQVSVLSPYLGMYV